MLTVTEAMEIKAPPAEVWKIVKSFDGIAAWIPPDDYEKVREGRGQAYTL